MNAERPRSDRGTPPRPDGGGETNPVPHRTRVMRHVVWAMLLTWLALVVLAVVLIRVN